MIEVEGVKIGFFGVTDGGHADVTSSPGDLEFSPRSVDGRSAQAKSCAKAGADLVVAVVARRRAPPIASLFESRAADLVLSGHDHDLMHPITTAARRWSESL